MSHQDRSRSPLERATETIDEGTTDAFGRLANETRLAILLALWEAADPSRPAAELHETTLSFSELRDRVGLMDSGQFNYHLSKLDGQFITRTAAGYTLTESATQFLRAIMAGTLADEPSFEGEPIDIDCRLCGAATVVDYRDSTLTHRCTSCDGAVEGSRSGTLAEVKQPPVGLLDRTPQEFFREALNYQRHRMVSMIEGTCMDCSGAVSSSIYSCSNHDTSTGTLCPRCEQHFHIEWAFICEVCKANFRLQGFAPLLAETEVVLFFYDHGIDILGANYWWDRFTGAIDQTEVQSEAPLRIRVSVRLDDDQLVAILDEDATVVDIIEPGN